MDILNDILDICCAEFEVSAEDVKSECRRQDLVLCRYAFAFSVWKIYGFNYATIAKPLNRTSNQVGDYIKHQPNSRGYAFLLSRVLDKIKTTYK